MIVEITRAILPTSRALPAISAMKPRAKGRRAAAFKATAMMIGPMTLAAFSVKIIEIFNSVDADELNTFFFYCSNLKNVA